MAINKNTYNRRNKMIYETYCAKWGEGLRDDVIYAELHVVFHLQPKTLEDIVRMMRKESQKNQTEIDFSNDIMTEGEND
jgi:hypothetical protein